MPNHQLPDGVFPACLTPLNSNLSVNFDKLVSHSQKMIDEGCDGLVILGTTGEANSFDTEERKAILQAVLKSGIEPNKILVGTGCCSLTETLNLTSHALDHGVNQVLVLPPFYYPKISDDGLITYFDQLIDRVNNPALSIYLYHFPSMSGVPFNHDVIRKLLEAYGPTLTGIKDSSGDWNNMMTMTSSFPDLKVYTGNEVFLSNLVSQGGAGTISATLNISAGLAADVYKNRNSESGVSLQEKLTSVRRAFEKFPMIPILKLVMSRIEEDEGWLNIRPPLAPLRFWNEDEVKEIIQSIQR